jgi:hypothetical protein
LLGIVIPTMALPMTFAATSWPVYVTNYANVSQLVRWAGAALTTAFCVAAVLAVTYMAERWHGREVVGRRAGADADGRADALTPEPSPLGMRDRSALPTGAS